jgi:DNA polymerase elongation subunit (family B)
MLENIYLENILCLDIETVPQYRTFEYCPDNLKLLWSRKANLLRKNEIESDNQLYQRAGIYAEFGKIICISVGFIKFNNHFRKFHLQSFADNDESKLLLEFKKFLNNLDNSTILCAHNGKEFDFPYISRRMIIHGISLPDVLNLHGKKPWEIQHLDTLELWKFGDYKNYTPLNLLAYILGINSPKDDIDGSMVADVYYKENNLLRIVEYCQKDVITVMQVLLRLRQENILNDIDIICPHSNSFSPAL